MTEEQRSFYILSNFPLLIVFILGKILLNLPMNSVKYSTVFSIKIVTVSCYA